MHGLKILRLSMCRLIIFILLYFSGISNETLTITSEELNYNKEQSSLLSVILLLSCVLSLSVLTSLYLEVGKKATETSTSKGVFLGNKN